MRNYDTLIVSFEAAVRYDLPPQGCYRLFHHHASAEFLKQESFNLCA
jgi:hypothetical protein